VLVETEAAQRRLGVDGEDLAGTAAGKQRQHDRHQATHDVGVGIAGERDHRIGARSALRLQPDLADAAADLVGVGARRLGERRKILAELDDVAVAVFPFVENGEVFADRFYRSHGRHIEPGAREGNRP